MSPQGAWKDERGFTLVEVLIVIVIMGIVLAIASSSWFGAVESRRVDSGTNRLAADLRHAHSRAINRLEPQTVDLTAGSSKYTIGPTASSCSVNPANPGCIEMDLDDFPGANVVVVNTGVTVAFCPNGSAEIPPATLVCSAAPSGASTTITVRSAKDTTKNHDIQINSVTSEIRIVP